MQVVVPGLLRGNLEDHLWCWPRLPHAPTAHILEADPFDHRNIGGERIFLWIRCLVEVEVFIDRAQLSLKEPFENQGQGVDQAAMK